MAERGIERNATEEIVGTADAETKPAEEEDAREITLTHLATSHQEWQQVEQRGFFWLFAVGVIFLVRLLFDPTMVRRPLLEPNLSIGGMIFICCSLFAFVMTNVWTGTPTEGDLHGPKAAAQLLVRDSEGPQADLSRHGPGYAVLTLLPSVPTMSLMTPPNSRSSGRSRRHDRDRLSPL
jgi:hypothetical protein